MANCAVIETTGPQEVVSNVIELAPSMYDVIAGWYVILYPTKRLAWVEDLDPAPGYYEPVWIDWYKNSEGLWVNPKVEPEFPPEPPDEE